MNTPLAPWHDLRLFRDGFYRCFERRADAPFALTDAIPSAGPQPSCAYLSLAAPHRRGWGSLYAALREGRLDAERLRAIPGRGASATDRPV